MLLSPTTNYFSSTEKLTISVRNAHQKELIFRDITSTRFLARAVLHYEQEPGEACFAPSRLGKNVHQWIGWLYSVITFRMQAGNSVPCHLQWILALPYRNEKIIINNLCNYAGTT
jgi:hypothetical protein